MPDVSLCLNELCPLRVKCVRYLAEPDPYRQVYSYFKFEEGNCDGFWDVENGASFKIRSFSEVDAENSS